MDHSVREDYLLSILRHQQRSGTDPDITSSGTYPSDDPEENRSVLESLAQSGDLIIGSDGKVHLTEKGKETSGAVFRKHKILESFFEEMLGMDRQAAHKQACTMEHIASDDTIGRLRSFISSRPACRVRRHSCWGQDKDGTCSCTPLSSVPENDLVRILGIRGHGRDLRLADLGLVPGEIIRIKRRSSHTMLISVKGCDIAISPEVADSVFVERVP